MPEPPNTGVQHPSTHHPPTHSPPDHPTTFGKGARGERDDGNARAADGRVRRRALRGTMAAIACATTTRARAPGAGRGPEASGALAAPQRDLDVVDESERADARREVHITVWRKSVTQRHVSHYSTLLADIQRASRENGSEKREKGPQPSSHREVQGRVPEARHGLTARPAGRASSRAARCGHRV